MIGQLLTKPIADSAPGQSQLGAEVEGAAADLRWMHANIFACRYDISWCPEWDSNPHCMVFETILSAVGVPGRACSIQECARFGPELVTPG